MSKIKLNYIKWGINTNKTIVPLYSLIDVVGCFTVENSRDGLYLSKYNCQKSDAIDQDLETYLNTEFSSNFIKKSTKIIGLLVNSPINSVEAICKALVINHSTIMIKGCDNILELLAHTFLEKRIIVLLDEFDLEQISIIKNFPNIMCVVQSSVNNKLFTATWTNIREEKQVHTNNIVEPLITPNKKKVTKFFVNEQGELSGMLTEEVDDTVFLKVSK